MARPRRDEDYTALFVRIPSAEAEKLHRAADVLGTPKRELITKLVARLRPGRSRLDAGRSQALRWPARRRSGRSASTRSARPRRLEILTPAQLAELLQVDEEVVVELAERQ